MADEVVVESSGSGDPEWDAAGAVAGGEEQPSEVVGEGAVATPEDPVADAPAADPDPFTPTKLQNGNLEIRLPNGERYEAPNELGLAQAIARSKQEANTYIAELKGKERGEQGKSAPVAPSVADSQIDPSAAALADLLAPAFGAKSGKELIDNYNSMMNRTTSLSVQAEEMAGDRAANQFVATTPDFHPSDTNAQRLGEAFAELSRMAGLPEGKTLPFTETNFKNAHFYAKGKGMYEASPAAATQNRSTPKPPPPPPSGNAPATLGKAAPTMEEFANLSEAEMEAELDRIYAAR